MHGSSAANSTCRNVGTEERVISGILGGICLAHGLETRVVPRPLSLLIAAGLIHRAVTGHCGGYSFLGLSTAEEPRTWRQECPPSPVITSPALASTGEFPLQDALNRS